MQSRRVQQYRMQLKSDRFASADGPQIHVRQWMPSVQIRAAVLIAHGAAEHAGRYERFSRALAADGFAVYAPDHRGHGQTAGSLEKAGNAGPDGFNGMIRDLKQLGELIRERYQVPLFLFGHSMGAALAQRFIQLHGDLLSGVVLSGSPGIRPNLDAAAAFTALAARGDQADGSSEIFRQSFAAYNKDFGRSETGYEWLTRDAIEVQKYVEDPWCGFPFTNRLVAEMSRCALEAAQEENIRRIPCALPIFLVSGGDDRVGGNGDYVDKLAGLYRKAGIADVQLKLYPEARHELLNETNRDEVQRDVLAWLEKSLR